MGDSIQITDKAPLITSEVGDQPKSNMVQLVSSPVICPSLAKLSKVMAHDINETKRKLRIVRMAAPLNHKTQRPVPGAA